MVYQSHPPSPTVAAAEVVLAAAAVVVVVGFALLERYQTYLIVLLQTSCHAHVDAQDIETDAVVVVVVVAAAAVAVDKDDAKVRIPLYHYVVQACSNLML